MRFDSATALKLAQMARRESGTISSTIRRLVAIGLAVEHRVVQLAVEQPQGRVDDSQDAGAV